MSVNKLRIHFLHILKSRTIVKHPQKLCCFLENSEITLVKDVSLFPFFKKKNNCLKSEAARSKCENAKLYLGWEGVIDFIE